MERTFGRLFKAGIWLKGIDGVLELAAGLLLALASRQRVSHLLFALAHWELHRYPGHLVHDVLHRFVSHWSVSSRAIGAAYLTVNGAVKIFVAAGILRGKLWCYPTAIAVISLCVLLQAARLCLRFSFPLSLGTLLDIAIIFLILHQYRMEMIGRGN